MTEKCQTVEPVQHMIRNTEIKTNYGVRVVVKTYKKDNIWSLAEYDKTQTCIKILNVPLFGYALASGLCIPQKFKSSIYKIT